ncbi:MAG: hypothetical protein WBB67_05840 [bacterium]
MKLAESIQLLIFIAILIATIFNVVAVCDQTDYNQESLRPWISCRTNDTLHIDSISKHIQYSYILKNYGVTPALEVSSYSKLFMDDTLFPSEDFKKQKQQDTLPPTVTIYPGESLPINRKLNYGSIISNDELFKLLTEDRFYLNIYVEYRDIHDELLGLRLIYHIKYDENKGLKNLTWSPIREEHKPIK